MKGFTLIELIVAVSVSLMVAGGIIVNYNSYNSSQTLKQTALTLKNNLRFIQSKASSGEKPSSSCTTLEGWNIAFTSDTQDYYTYKANCPGDTIPDSAKVYLPAGVTFETLPTANPITYYVLSRGTNLASTTTIVLSGFDKKYALQLSPGGDINDLGFQ